MIAVIGKACGRVPHNFVTDTFSLAKPFEFARKCSGIESGAAVFDVSDSSHPHSSIHSFAPWLNSCFMVASFAEPGLD